MACRCAAVAVFWARVCGLSNLALGSVMTLRARHGSDGPLCSLILLFMQLCWLHRCLCFLLDVSNHADRSHMSTLLSAK